jgi:murein DD-endopeptidase MepM/ murein hydrolase activator NlpD
MFCMKLFALFGSVILAAQVNVALPTVPEATPGQISAMVSELRQKHLLTPIRGFNIESIKGSYYTGRSEGRMHRAADFLAERGTPIQAVDDGTLARLFSSKLGGLTIYQTDPSARYVYYYAHLDSYAAGLAEGARISKGQVIGYVGQTGNATTPHCHFAIWQTTPEKIWDGIAIDPYEVFTNTKSAAEPTPAPEPKQSPKPRKLWAIPTTKGTWI